MSSSDYVFKGVRGKQPYAIAMKVGSPFGLAGLWELAWPEHRWVGAHLCRDRGALEQAGGSNPRPDARYPRARELWPLA